MNLVSFLSENIIHEIDTRGVVFLSAFAFFSKQAETESLVKFKPYDSILAFFMGQDYIFFHRVKFFQNSLMKDSY